MLSGVLKNVTEMIWGKLKVVDNDVTLVSRDTHFRRRRLPARVLRDVFS